MGYRWRVEMFGGSSVGRRIVDRLRWSVPWGGPSRPYLSVLTVLTRRLSEDEVELIVSRSMNGAETFIDDATIGTLIMEITQELPLPGDVARVRARMIRLSPPT